MEIVPLADRKEFIWELAELHQLEWRHLDPSLTLEKRADEISKAAGRNGIPSIFIAAFKNKLIGSAALVKHDLKSKPNLYPCLAAVYVKEKFRNQGIASALIAKCEYEASQSGYDVWYLSTEFASKLYEKLGWKHLEQYEYNRVILNIMSKRIGN